MRRLVEGVLDFRRRLLPSMRGHFASLRHAQKPDSLFIACSDSRVVPNLFSSTNPGDLFVMRNVGNIVPPAGVKDEDMLSEGAAVEFSVQMLNVRDIVVCGHSECGAMVATNALINPEVKEKPKLPPHLDLWLKYAFPAAKRLVAGEVLDSSWSVANQLSQLNTLHQLQNVRSYPIVAQRMKEGKLDLHAWWFDISTGDVYCFDGRLKKFVILDEEHAKEMLINH